MRTVHPAPPNYTLRLRHLVRAFNPGIGVEWGVPFEAHVGVRAELAQAHTHAPHPNVPWIQKRPQVGVSGENPEGLESAKSHPLMLQKPDPEYVDCLAMKVYVLSFFTRIGYASSV